MDNTQPAWLLDFQNQLEVQSSLQTLPFFRDWEKNNDLYLQNVLIKKENEELKGKVVAVKESENPKITELLGQLEKLKAEQQDLYRNSATNAQRIVSLIDSGKVDSDKIVKLMGDLDISVKVVANLKRQLEDSNGLLKEKDRVIEILKDELAAHQLELVQREEQLQRTTEKATQLEADNKTLVDRWLLLKEKDAAKMNEAIETETSKIQKNFMASKVFSLFRTPSAIDSPSSAAAGPASSGGAVFASPIHLQTNASILPKKLLRLIKAPHDDDINCIAVSHDGSWIVTGGNDKKLVLYQASSGQVKSLLQGSLKAITSVCFSRAGDLVMASSNDNSIKLWNMETKRLTQTLTGHMQNVYSAKFASNDLVISGSHDRTIKVWDLNKGYCVKNIFTLSSCNDVAPMNSEGSLIASGHLDNNLRIWDLKSGNLIREVTNIHFQQITSVQVSADETSILTTSRDNTLKIIDTRMFLPTATMSAVGFRVPSNWAKSCFSSDGVFVASGSLDGNVYIWKDGGLVETLSKHGAGVVGVCWSPSGGSTLYSASDKDRTVIEWTD